jgi:hypothetical protein
MSLSAIRSGIPPIAQSLNADTLDALNSAASQVGSNNGLIAQAEAVAKDNILRQIRATDWTSGIKTEKDLLAKGVSLAKA